MHPDYSWRVTIVFVVPILGPVCIGAQASSAGLFLGRRIFSMAGK